MFRRAIQSLKRKTTSMSGKKLTGLTWVLKNLLSSAMSSRRSKMTFSIMVVLLLFFSVLVVFIDLGTLGSVHNSSGESASLLPSYIGDFTKISNSTASPRLEVPFLYIGSEACPFCAAESWSLYVALKAEGGDWHSISYSYSNNTDKYPRTPGIDFAKTYLTDSMVIFDGYEISDVNWKTLQILNSSNDAIFNTLDPHNYLPFMLIGGIYLHIGGSYPAAPFANLTGPQVMSLVGNAKSTLRAIVGNESNVIEKVTTTLINYSRAQIPTFVLKDESHFNATLAQITWKQALERQDALLLRILVSKLVSTLKF